MKQLTSKFRKFTATWNEDLKQYDIKHRGSNFGSVDQDGQWSPSEIHDTMLLDASDIKEFADFVDQIFETICKPGHPIHK